MPNIIANPTTGLLAALNAAKPGDTILLATGKYPFFMDGAARDFGPSGLMITSQDVGHPASVAGFNISNWKSATISNLIVTWAKEQNAIIDLSACTDLVLDHLDLNGSGDTGAAAVIVGATYGVNFVNQTPGCKLTNSLIHNIRGGVGVWNQAGQAANVGPVLIDHNEIWNVNGDAINCRSGSKITISHNTVHDFVDPKDGSHADALQVENDASPIDDLTVTDNWFYSGASTYGFQGVFLVGYPGFGPINRLTVERNVVSVAGQVNGIYVTGANGGTVKDNYAVGPGSMKVHVYSSIGLVISGNTSNNLDLYANDATTTVGVNPVIPVVSDFAAATAHAVATGAGAGPRASLGPQAAASTAPAPSLAPVVADLTAKLAAATAQHTADGATVASLQSQLAAAQATLSAVKSLVSA